MAAVDPDVALRIAKTIADLYGDAAARLLQLVAQRLAGGIEQPGWAEAKLAELLPLSDEAAAIVAQLTADAPAIIEAAITEANTIGITATGIDPTLAPVTNQAAVQALATETVQAVTAPHQAILRTVLDVYRTVIVETAAPGVVTGIETRRQAAQRALDRFADQGVTGFVDRAGRRWEMQSYAEMATRTASGRAMVEGRLAGYTEQGRTLVIVSDAPAECSACRPFEGKLLSIGGAEVGERHGGIEVVDTVSGARARGLFHANCRHDLRPYIDGLTRPMTHTADPDGDQARQEQRRLERGVRQWKRREAAAMDEATRRKAAARRAEWSKRLAEHVDQNDLKRLRYREQIGAAR